MVHPPFQNSGAPLCERLGFNKNVFLIF